MIIYALMSYRQLLQASKNMSNRKYQKLIQQFFILQLLLKQVYHVFVGTSSSHIKTKSIFIFNMGVVECRCDDFSRNQQSHSFTVAPKTSNTFQCQAKPTRHHRICSIVNPQKHPKIFETPIIQRTPTPQQNVSPVHRNQPPMVPASLKLTPHTANKPPDLGRSVNSPVVFNITTGSFLKHFQFGTDRSLPPQYQVDNTTQQENFKLSIHYRDHQTRGHAFYLKDEGIGLGCFYKLQSPVIKLELTSNMLISIGNEFIVPCIRRSNSHIHNFQMSGSLTNPLGESQVCNYPRDSTTLQKPLMSQSLELKVYGGCASNQSLVLDVSMGNQVTVGRSSCCSLSINDNILSKVQLKITRDSKSNRWYLSDGDGSNASKNGTWVYMSNLTRVTDGMLIRCGSKYFYSLQVIK